MSKNRIDLKELIEEAGYEPRDYSGRAMYERRCVSVILGREQSEFKFMADLFAALDLEDPQGYVDFGLIQEFCNLISETKTDQMGLGTVVYWPDLEWAKTK